MKTIKVDYGSSLEGVQNDSKFNEFKELVRPGNVDYTLLSKFFTGFAVDDKFTYYKMHVRQHKYSDEELLVIRKVVSHYAYMNDATVARAFNKRVTKKDKELSYKAFINTKNMWLLLTNAMSEPVKLSLRGSTNDK